MLGEAPDFTDNQRWFNTPGGRPLTLAQPARQGRADRLLDLHLHQLHPHPAARRRPGTTATRTTGFVVVGVHSPEFVFEKDDGERRDAIRRFGIHYPVAQDNDYGTWKAFGNQYWPAEYLIDTRGNVRYAHFGEGNYGRPKPRSARCSPRRAARPLGHRAKARAEASARVQTPRPTSATSGPTGCSPPPSLRGLTATARSAVACRSAI